jgi:hypothetical protein
MSDQRKGYENLLGNFLITHSAKSSHLYRRTDSSFAFDSIITSMSASMPWRFSRPSCPM